MKCPHCDANLRYGERSNYTCSRCQRQFALEPKQNKLKLHDLAFRRRLDQVSQHGTLYFTVDQLRYQLNRKHLTELAKSFTSWRDPGELISLALPTLMISFFFSGPIYVFLTLSIEIQFIKVILEIIGENVFFIIVAVFCCITGMSIAIFISYQRSRGDIAPEPSLPEFEHTFLRRWEEIYPGTLERLIRPDLLAQLPDSPPPSRMRGALVCAQRDILEFLRANRVPARLGLALLPFKEPFSTTQQAALDRLRSQPTLPVLVLHDASPTGWLLPRIVTKALQLPADQPVIDVGLKLADAMAGKIPPSRKKPSNAQIKQLKTHVASTASPPPPADTIQHSLTPEEFEWLAKGWYTPLVALAPSKLIRMVARAARKYCPAPTRRPAVASPPDRTAMPHTTPPVVDAEQQAQTYARMVGFMSWPEG